MPITEQEAARELAHGRQAPWWGALKQAAAAQNLELAFVLAIGSRETNLRDETGDGGHGHGVLQVDDRWHPEVAGKPIHRATPEELIDAGCQILAEAVRGVAHAHPDWPPDDQLKVAASAYNAGLRAALRGSAEGDSDKYATPPPYGRDVMQRRAVFKSLLPPPYGTATK